MYCYDISSLSINLKFGWVLNLNIISGNILAVIVTITNNPLADRSGYIVSKFEHVWAGAGVLVKLKKIEHVRMGVVLVGGGLILDPGQLGPCAARYGPNKIEYGWGPCTMGLGGALYSEGGGSAGPGTCKRGTDGHINTRG